MRTREFHNASCLFTMDINIFMRSRAMKLLEARTQEGKSHMKFEELDVAIILNS